MARDEDHADQLHKCILERVTEEMCTPNIPLAESALCERATKLMTKGAKPAKAVEVPSSPLGSDQEDGVQESLDDVSSCSTAKSLVKKKSKKAKKAKDGKKGKKA